MEFVKFQFVENPGMAFGWSFGKVWGKVALSIFRIVAVVFIALYINRLIKSLANKFYLLCISLIFAGALGNIIDSAFYGLLFDSGTTWSEQISWLDSLILVFPKNGFSLDMLVFYRVVCSRYDTFGILLALLGTI